MCTHQPTIVVMMSAAEHEFTAESSMYILLNIFFFCIFFCTFKMVCRHLSFISMLCNFLHSTSILRSKPPSKTTNCLHCHLFYYCVRPSLWLPLIPLQVSIHRRGFLHNSAATVLTLLWRQHDNLVVCHHQRRAL